MKLMKFGMKTKAKNYLNFLDKQLLFVIYIGFLVYMYQQLIPQTVLN